MRETTDEKNRQGCRQPARPSPAFAEAPPPTPSLSLLATTVRLSSSECRHRASLLQALSSSPEPPIVATVATAPRPPRYASASPDLTTKPRSCIRPDDRNSPPPPALRRLSAGVRVAECSASIGDVLYPSCAASAAEENLSFASTTQPPTQPTTQFPTP
ncbi:hypothetical protein CDD80_1806 [Ophiocordyceps camponoti-rufipedis]|uniref:Uncharacterized protein n=1 Tax=Ophiocordyceps camponoti-rufipedis TaxID=2004952 RepID=A0A2C5ZM25_9HYPO|nr:hypothetical protein CDD80_1806 [Ophiocordyceps camponoti-rufipedis]